MKSLLLFCPFLAIAACSETGNYSEQDHSFPNDQQRATLSNEMLQQLQQHVLDPWYPAAVDEEYGGYFTRFNYRWERDDHQPKMVVSQARLIWTASVASDLVDDNKLLLESAGHGVEFLRDVMWDDEYGGFYDLVSREGDVTPESDGRIIKQAYGQSFAIYGLAAYVKATGDQEALDLAIEAFQWLEEHSYDPEYGGYFNYLERDGTALRDWHNGTPPKDQNSSIHLLEAFTYLYEVWPDPLLRERLNHMLELIRDTIRIDPGYLVLFSEEDWTPVSYRDSSDAVRDQNYYFDHVSFGHDVETAFLMIEASNALGIENDTITHFYAKQMVDHSLKTGWDDEKGGFYDGGYYLAGDDELTIVRDTKTWWAQAEGLNALLMMSLLYPDDEIQYGDHFIEMWEYINEYFIDEEHGGWFESGLDKSPDARTDAKGHIWKANYHDGRAMMYGIRFLDGE